MEKIDEIISLVRTNYGTYTIFALNGELERRRLLDDWVLGGEERPALLMEQAFDIFIKEKEKGGKVPGI